MRGCGGDTVWSEVDYALPAGFPFIVDDDNLVVLEDVLLYLHATFIKATGAGLAKHRRRTSMHSVHAAAYDLVDFLRFIVFRIAQRQPGIVISEPQDSGVDHFHLPKFSYSDVIAYRDNLYTRISKQTHEPLADQTCGRRVYRALHYADWLAKRGRLLDEDSRPDIVVVQTNDKDYFVRTLTEQSWRGLQNRLGPLPSQRSEYGFPSSRPRLTAELSLSTGLRVDEVARLTIHQILSLPYDSQATPESKVPLRVTRTKRLKPRTVELPMYLLYELQLYIDGERRDALREAEKYWLRDDSRRPSALFLNGTDAHQHAGKPVKADVISDDFHQACLRNALTSVREKIDPESGVTYFTSVAQHRFHDLRHTFAVWMYLSEKASGNAEPWKQIQTLLGHTSLKTTMDIYLKVVNVERQAINASVFDATRRSWNGD
ncbi:site-specific tyrosine recombinase XerC [Caballeronia concitans]|uniref:Site-specific tyrosine recombinase XerC n=1 Tax=Caballeronia concitans TaxID=1777133 RepID=A0A658R5H0_9BURK|nr:site-specific tyrosine recombinase XerC [Caballeronia concitans]